MIVAMRVICNAPVVITQGSYSGGVSASAGTHDRGGAVDIRVKDLSPRERVEVETCGRRVGFAAWIRDPDEGDWPWHIHMIAIGCPDLSSGARAQVTAYKNGRNGLRNNGPDTGSRAYVSWTWEKYKAAYPDLLEEFMSAADVTKIINQVNAVSAHLAKNTAQNRQTLFSDVAELIKLSQSGQTEQVLAFARQVDAANDAEVAKLQVKLDAALAKLAEVDAEVEALAPKA